MCEVKNSQKYIFGGVGYLFVYELVLSRRLKTHNCILETEGNSSNLEILVKFNFCIDMDVMCHISRLFTKELLALKL